MRRTGLVLQEKERKKSEGRRKTTALIDAVAKTLGGCTNGGKRKQRLESPCLRTT